LSTILKAQNISKSYPSINTAGNRFKALIALLRDKKIKNSTVVLKNIDLEVKKGESLAIIGKNGAGKSTLLKILSEVIKPTSGTVAVNGKIGALLELGSGFHPEYSGRENLKMSAALYGLKAGEITNKIDQMIKFADIGKYIDQPVKNYSSGMVVRLGFSIVTVTKPDLLITDEVLAVGDTDFQRKCIAWIDGYLKQGGTLLLVSHSIYHVQKLCKRAIWLENGQIKKSGDSFLVSQEYQSFYEKNTDNTVREGRDLTNYHIKQLKILNKDLNEITQIETHAKLVIKVKLRSPDNRPPGMALGFMQSNFPIYGTISDLHEAVPKKTADKEYEYTITLESNKLLPADYTIKAHAMDPECLRLMDSYEKPLRVHSQTQELGVVQLETKWS